MWNNEIFPARAAFPLARGVVLDRYSSMESVLDNRTAVLFPAPNILQNALWRKISFVLCAFVIIAAFVIASVAKQSLSR